MTLTQTLRIEERYLQFEDLRAIAYCEKRWQEAGHPLKRWDLVNFVERMLKELQNNGIGYPKVLLLRKKEIQRRTFTLPEPGAQQASWECAACWDGFLPSGKPCDCPKGERQKAKLRAWGMNI